MPQFNALGAIDAFNAGRGQRRENALMEFAREDRQREQGMVNTQGKIENALLSGDRDAAQSLAQGSGDADVMAGFRDTIGQMDENQRALALERAQAFAGVGASLLQQPYEARVSALRNSQVQQQLQAYGIDPQQLAGFDPTDENIHAVLGPAAEMSEMLDRTAPQTVGENDTLLTSRNGGYEQTIGLAGQEARALEGRGVAVDEGQLNVNRGALALDRDELTENRRQFDVGQEASSGPSVEREESIRTEAERSVSEFRDIESAFTRVRAAAEDPSAAGDLALIFNFMKMQDPGSTVREGEFATAQNAAGVPSRARAAYNNILRGERLTPGQRQDFVGTSERLYTAQRGLAENRVAQFREMAASENLRPEFAIPRFAEFDDGPQGSAAPDLDVSGYDNGTLIEGPEGERYVVRNGRLERQ